MTSNVNVSKVVNLIADQRNADINLTTKAENKIYELLQEDHTLCFRTQIIGGGCKGLSYQFSFDNMNEDDYIKHYRFTVVIDEISYPYLKNSSIDYINDSSGEYFAVNNPQAETKCSCGSSFNQG